jgi:hypothetical protein
VSPFASAPQHPAGARQLRLLRRRLILAQRRRSRRAVMDRRERTRALIGLGGLVAKAGLGDEPTAVLFGLLLDARDQLAGPEAEVQRTRWHRRGDRAFKADAAAKADAATGDG